MTTAALVRLRTVLLGIMLAAMVLAVSIVVFWIVADESSGEYVLVTALIVGAFSFTALMCVNMLTRGRYKGVMWTGTIASLLACLIWQPVIMMEWWRYSNPQSIALAGTALSIVAGWCTLFAGLKSHTWINTLGSIVVNFTLAVAAFVGVMIFFGVALEPRNDGYFATMGVASLLGGCGLVTSMALAMMSRVRHQGQGETLSGKVAVELTCPRCRTSQTIRPGMARCSSCKLRIEVIVEEPVCACGYQLYQLTGATCPECGREIPESDRWASQMNQTDASPASVIAPPTEVS